MWKHWPKPDLQKLGYDPVRDIALTNWHELTKLHEIQSWIKAVMLEELEFKVQGPSYQS